MGEEKYHNENMFDEIFNGNMLFQNDDTIEQHPFLNKIYPYSLSIIHLVTYCENNTVALLSGSLEIGTIDSPAGFEEQIGEVSCGLDQEGYLKSYAYNLKTHQKMGKHPQTRFVFEGSQIPHFDKLKSYAINLHIQNKVDDVISWKLALDSTGKVFLISWLKDKETLL